MYVFLVRAKLTYGSYRKPWGATPRNKGGGKITKGRKTWSNIFVLKSNWTFPILQTNSFASFFHQFCLRRSKKPRTGRSRRGPLAGHEIWINHRGVLRFLCQFFSVSEFRKLHVSKICWDSEQESLTKTLDISFLEKFSTFREMWRGWQRKF